METLVIDNRRGLWVHLLAVLGLLAVTYANIVPGMVAQWGEDPNYSHGFLVPVVSAYFLWERRQELLAARPGGGAAWVAAAAAGGGAAGLWLCRD